MVSKHLYNRVTNRYDQPNNSGLIYSFNNSDPNYDDLVYQNLLDNLTDSTGGTVDNVVFLPPNSSSLLLVNGYINTGVILGDTFTLSFWYEIGTDETNPLVYVENGILISYNTINSTLTISKYFYTNSFVENTINVTFESDWNFIYITRDHEILKIYINNELVYTDNKFYYSLSNPVYIGDTATGYNGNLSTLKLYDKNIVLYTEGIDRYKTESINALSNYNEYCVYGITNRSISDFIFDNNISIKSNTITYELYFAINNILDTTIISNMSKYLNRVFYIDYKQNNTLEFTHYNLSGVSTTEVLGNYIPDIYNHLVLEIDRTNTFSIYLNGVLKFQDQINTLVENTMYLEINTNPLNRINTQDLYVKYFNVYYIKVFDADFFPLNEKVFPVYLARDIVKTRFPAKFNTIIPLNYSINGVSSNIENQQSITITQEIQSPSNEVYRLEKTKKTIDVVDLDEITIPTEVTILKDTKEASFDIEIDNYEAKHGRKEFSISISNSFYTKELYFSIVDNRELASTVFSSIESYLDGYFFDSNSLDNIEGTRTASTASSLVTSIAASGRLITNDSHKVNIPTLTGIKTVILAYYELSNKANRGYIGNSNGYLFNGGALGELVGNLQVIPNDWTVALSLNIKSDSIKINKNETVIVLNDIVNKKIKVFEKINNKWVTTFTELFLDVEDIHVTNTVSIDITEDGQAFCLGFREANNGEGVVQVWELINSIWTKTLHLGSPNPIPNLGGFGYSVKLNSSKNKLLASEIGTNSVFEFSKGTVWNTTPTQTLTGTNDFGRNIEATNDFNLIVINNSNGNVYIYRNYILEETLTDAYSLSLKDNNTLVLGNLISREVKIYSYSTEWNLVDTISSSSNLFGRSVSINSNSEVLVSSEEVSNLYSSSDSYTSVQYVANNGYSSYLTENIIITTNYDGNILILTTDASTVSNPITYVRQNFETSTVSDVLKRSDINLLTFSSSSEFTVDIIGSNRNEDSLNGIVYAALFFDDVLSVSQIQNIEDLISQWLYIFNYNFGKI